jgi:hypothetical protein
VPMKPEEPVTRTERGARIMPLGRESTALRFPLDFHTFCLPPGLVPVGCDRISHRLPAMQAA